MRPIPANCINRQLEKLLETIGEGGFSIGPTENPAAVPISFEEYRHLLNIEAKYLADVAEVLDSGNQWVNRGDTITRLMTGHEERKKQ